MADEGNLLIGIEGVAFIARLEGHLTQKSLWRIQAAAHQCSVNAAVRDLLVDVSACLYLDSTMLGSLARWAIAFGRDRERCAFLVGLRGGPLERMFERMNLTQLFSVAPDSMGVPAGAWLAIAEGEDRGAGARANGVLSAHEALAELSPENAREFALLIELLRAEVAAAAEQ